jgi:glutamate 5-kinase
VGTAVFYYGIHVGQMLLTRADMEDSERFLNARDTLRAAG